MAESVSTHDYLPAFHFLVSIGDEDLGFKEVSGLGIELETEDVLEGGGFNYVYRLPKPAKAKNLVLKRAMQQCPDELYTWIHDAIIDFKFDLREVLVMMVDENDTIIKGWKFLNAYPVKATYSGLDSTKNELVIQTLELAYATQQIFDVA